MNRSNLTVVDLFAGAGGLLLGFEQAGFETISANEIDRSCLEMLALNYPWVHTIGRSIEEINGLDLMLGKKQEVDVLVGGPPCQGFSLIGLRDAKDPRNKLVFHYIRMLREIKPKTFLFENVPGMLSTLKGKFVEGLIDEFGKAGYDVVSPIKILAADDFGVPQHRQRVFIMGVRRGLGIKLTYPDPTHLSPEKRSLQYLTCLNKNSH